MICMRPVKQGQQERLGYVSKCGMFKIRMVTSCTEITPWELLDYIDERIDINWNRAELAERNGFVLEYKEPWN